MAGWVAIIGLIAAIGIFGWSIPRGLEMSADEGSHFLEAARPWDCGYFHTLYAWYAHGAWKLLGASVIRMRWFALFVQLGCTMALSLAALGWLRRSGFRQIPAADWLVPLAMTWSLVCYTLGSITVTYTSLANWAATLWLAFVLHFEHREGKTGIGGILLVWIMAVISCTSKPSTGGLLLVFSFLLTCGWRLESSVLARRIQIATLTLFVLVSALLSMKLVSVGSDSGAWDLSVKSSPIANFFAWASRYLASDSLRLAVSALWREPCREMWATLTHYGATTAGVAALLLCRTLDRWFSGWSARRLEVAGAFAGVLLVGVAGGLRGLEETSPTLIQTLMAFAGAMAITVLNPGAGVAAAVCALFAQFFADAFSIHHPRDAIFWAADHEFRLAFMALVMAAALLWLSGPEKGAAIGRNAAVNLPLIVVATLLMPVIGWFGSGCLLGARAGYQYSVWLIIAAVMLTSASNRTTSWNRFATLVFSLVMTSLAINAIYVTRAVRPINRGLAVAGEETRKIKTGPSSEELVFNRKAAGFLSRVKSVLKESGFKKGDPILAFYDFPGLVYLVGGISPGASWFIPPSSAPHVTAGAQIHQYNLQRLADISSDVLRRSFIFQTDHDPTLEALLGSRGIKFPDSYDKSAEISIPSGVNNHRTLTVWKPKVSDALSRDTPARSDQQ